MAIIKTSGLTSFPSYDSANDLNYFLNSDAFGAANYAANLFASSLGGFASKLGDFLLDAVVTQDGTSATFDGFGQFTLTGKNLGALQTGKGLATINSLAASYDGNAFRLDGNVQVSAKGVASGTISAASYYDTSGCDIDSLVNFAGKAIIKNSSLISVSFTSATVTTFDSGDAPIRENVIDSVTVTGNFKLTENGPDGNVTGISFIGDGENQLNVTNMKGVLLSDILDEGFNKELILSGADTITAVYTDKNGYFDTKINNVEFAPGATIDGYAGSDSLIGGDRSDFLFGGTGNDLLRGNAGNDLLDGGEGADRLTGGTGDDLYILDNAKDLVAEAAVGGHDTLILEVSDSFTVFKMGTGVEDAIVDFESSFGESGYGVDVIVVGNALDNLIVGGIGDDSLSGESGNDVLVGDGGFLFDSPINNISVQGLYYPFGGDDTINGGRGNDVLYGGNGNNVLTGGLGNDLFVYSPAIDGFGEDSFDFNGPANNRITDFKAGSDKLVLQLDGPWQDNYGADGLDTLGIVSSGNALFDESNMTLHTLAGEDFHLVSEFNENGTFEESGVYFDTADNQVWYVEHYDAQSGYIGSGYAAHDEVFLVATLDGNVNLRASDIVIASFDYPVG